MSLPTAWWKDEMGMVHPKSRPPPGPGLMPAFGIALTDGVCLGG